MYTHEYTNLHKAHILEEKIILKRSMTSRKLHHEATILPFSLFLG